MAKLFESISCSVLAFSVLFNPTVILCPFVSFSKRGFSVRSFETGTHVKLPGPAPDKPNVYDFKTTYDQMYNDLLRKDKELYTQNGILHMLDRNKRIKPRPERFQNCKDVFDLILTCEERVYDQAVEDLNSREQETCQPVHVINVDIQDNHEKATLGAFLICELCQCVSIGLPGPPPARQGFSRKLTSHSVHVQIISKGYNPELQRCPQV